MKIHSWYLAALPLLAVALAFGQETPPSTDTPAAPPPNGTAGRGPQQPQIKPYDKVITKEAATRDGVFKVHRIKEKVYYEIPKAELDGEFLWVSQIARTTLGVGYGGQAMGNHVVKWERRGDHVLLRSVLYEIVADAKEPISHAVQAANNDSILMAFNIEALGKDDAPVIEVTRLFTTEAPEFSARARLRARAFDAARSFLDRATPYPTNIEVEATQTYTTPIEPPRLPVRSVRRSR